MGSLRYLALFALLLSIFFAVSADTSNEATHAKDEVKPSEATNAIEPQQIGSGFCRHGCCGGRNPLGQCRACCKQPQAAKAEANSQPQATEAEAEPQKAKNEVTPSEATDAIEPQSLRCKHGCCGKRSKLGRCMACCSQPQPAKSEANSQPKATEAEAEDSSQPQVSEDEANDVVVEPQQRGRGGCRYGCCGGWMFGRCMYCCRSQAEASEILEAVEPQDVRGGGGGCRNGCCGKWRYGKCTYCCSRRQDKADVVEPQQRGGCWFGCCGSYGNGQCSACCLKKMDTEEEKKKEEAKP